MRSTVKAAKKISANICNENLYKLVQLVCPFLKSIAVTQMQHISKI